MSIRGFVYNCASDVHEVTLRKIDLSNDSDPVSESTNTFEAYAWLTGWL